MRKYCLLYLILFLSLLPASVLAETALTFTSPKKQATLLELYTSEGCSSCPPADRWLSTLKDHPQLWKQVIPIAFHVDYWNYLGWKDVFSKQAYSQRQRNYARFKNLRTVYTPGFLRNGNEWRGWFRNRSLAFSLGAEVGRLEVTIDNDTVTAKFQPARSSTNSPLILNIAWLGFDLVTEVGGGENEGKQLKHDFVSYHTDAKLSSIEDGTHYWRFPLATPTDFLPKQKGLVFWVTRRGNPTPIQATGGWF
jgi:hypothetical protein